MTIDIYSTRTMLRMLEQSKPARSFLLDTFFRETEVSDTEHVDIDIVVGARRLAPFVSPLAEGKVIASAGFETKTIKPPYVKIKDVIPAADLTQREPGEHIYSGNLSPAQRAAKRLGKKLREFRAMIVRRMEWMAASALNTGSIAVVGEGFNAVIDFAMPAGHKVTLTGTALWTDAASDPVTNLRNWRQTVAKASGLVPDVAVFGSNVIDTFLNNAKVRDLLNNRRLVLGEINLQDLAALGARYVGNFEGLDIYGYDEWYLDGSGVEQPMVPVDKVWLGSTRARAARHFGMIRDLKASASVPFFPKSWEVEDPSARILLVQSAPLVALHQSNAFLSAKVI